MVASSTHKEIFTNEQIAELIKQSRKNKYGAERCSLDGISFASKREMKRYAALVWMQKAGEITKLDRQTRIALNAESGMKVGEYIADFTYFDKSGAWVIEDSKGFKTELYVWKKRHVKAQYGIEVLET